MHTHTLTHTYTHTSFICSSPYLEPISTFRSVLMRPLLYRGSCVYFSFSAFPSSFSTPTRVQRSHAEPSDPGGRWLRLNSSSWVCRTLGKQVQNDRRPKYKGSKWMESVYTARFAQLSTYLVLFRGWVEGGGCKGRTTKEQNKRGQVWGGNASAKYGHGSNAECGKCARTP